MQFFKTGTAVDPVLDQGDIGMKMSKNEYAIGKPLSLEIKNNTAETVVIPSECPEAPLQIFMFKSAGYEEIKSDLEIDCSKVQDITIAAGAKTTVTYNDYLYSLFGQVGRYKIEYGAFSTPEFLIVEPNFHKCMEKSDLSADAESSNCNFDIHAGPQSWSWNNSINNFNQNNSTYTFSKGMKAQRRMQILQPKLEELKKKHASDQQRLAQETMLLWKNHKVNPLSSCLPLLIQLPILIGLYDVILGRPKPGQSYIDIWIHA